MKIKKKLGRSGASKTVILPKIILDEWKNNNNENVESVNMYFENGKIIIEPSKNEKMG